MYCGIVQGAFPIINVERKDGLLIFCVSVSKEIRNGLAVGASVAVDGVCLTVTRIEGDLIAFDVMQQTLVTTTLFAIQKNDLVNIERSMTQGAEVGGHLISGHVDGMATVAQIDRPPNNFVLTVRLPELWMKYVFPKGFIALNGVSLTVGQIDKANHTITVYLIPETLRRTSFVDKQIGSAINFEVERQTQAIVDTIRDFLEELIARRELSTAEIRRLQDAPLPVDLHRNKNEED